MKEKSYYNGSDCYFTDLINENRNVFSNTNALWIRYAGYRKHKSAKKILHDSLLELKKTLNELYFGVFFVSTIVKLSSYENYGYFIFFPENNLMIKILADASYEEIYINQTTIKKEMNRFYADKIYEYVFSSPFGRSEEAKQYTNDFCEAVKQLNLN